MRGLEIPARGGVAARASTCVRHAAGVSLALWGCLAWTAPDAFARTGDWRVLEAKGDRVYLAAPDSGVAREGQRLALIERRAVIATARVTQVIDAVLAIARIDSGSVARVRRLERLRVRADAAIAPPTSWRVGIPRPPRHGLLVRCPGSTFSPPGGAGVYRAEPLADGATRWVRVPGAVASAWPDTVDVVGFGVDSDEEIAFERGELDVALFWPGEMSMRLRESPRWGGAWRGRRARGVIAIQRLGPGGPATDSVAVASLDGVDLDALNARVFRGDLAPWEERATADSAVGRRRTGRVRFDVDDALPGARALERALAAAASGDADRTTTVVRVLYLDTPSTPPATVERALRTLGVRPVFAVRGTLVCRPEFRATVDAIGVEALMARWACDAAELEP